MRIAHIFMVHKNPAQLELLIKTMRHPDFDFYIHVDKKADSQPFKYLSNLGQVYFIENRTVCNWGGFSLVKAITTSIDQVQQSNIRYDFVNLLSAQDFPIKPIDDIYRFFEQNIGSSFLSFDASSETTWWKGAVDRYKKYHFTDLKFKGAFFLQKIINAIAPARTFLDHFPKLYGGSDSSWWTISFDCAVYLSAYFKAHPALAKKLNYTWGSDEIIVATILMNSPYRDKIINNNYRYIKFIDDSGHPEILTGKDYEAMIHSPKFFARKFDLQVDSSVLFNLQTTVSRHQPQPSSPV